MLALLGPGDHAIVTVPNYQSMETMPVTIAGKVTGIALRPENRWQLDLDDVRAALRPETKLIAVNFPNNPTGTIADQAIFRDLVALCAERGIHLFSDEVYRGLEIEDAKRLPQAADLFDRGISLNVMSKAYGLPGLRIGWIACRDHALLERMEKMKHYLSICNARPSEVLAGIAIKARETIFARNRALCADNIAKIGAFFADYPDLYEWVAPDGGCVAFTRYLGKDGVEDIAAGWSRRRGFCFSLRASSFPISCPCRWIVSASVSGARISRRALRPGGSSCRKPDCKGLAGLLARPFSR